jgi:PAS domain S-box-containing protein
MTRGLNIPHLLRLMAGPTRRRAGMLSAITLVAGLSLTALGVHQQSTNAQDAAQQRFDRYSAKIEDSVRDRFANAHRGLMALRSTFLAHGGVLDRLAFRTWVVSRQVSEDLPGVRGLGFIERVERPQLDAFVARERADHAPDFMIHTVGQASDLLLIKFIEPLTNNRAAWGYDVGSEGVRRRAAQWAIDSGEATLTGRIVLLQDGAKRPGLLYFMPVYRPDVPVRTVAQRRAALLGLLYTPIVVEELVAGVGDVADKLLDFELVDGKTQARDQLLFDLDKQFSAEQGAQRRARISIAKLMAVGGRPLTINISSTSTFDADAQSQAPLWVAVVGALLSTLMASTVWLLGAGRARAEELAHKMTADLAAAKDRAEAALRDSGVLLDTLDRYFLTSVADAHGKILQVNDAFCHLSGYSREALVGADHRLINSGHHDQAFWADMWSTILAGRPWRGEVCNKAPDGRLYWVNSIIAPLVGADGRIDKYISIRTDVTQAKQLDERFNLAIEGGNDGLWDWLDVYAHEEWWSPQFYRLLGYEPGEISADLVTFDSLLHPEDQAPAFAAITAALEERKPFDVEYRLQTKSGQFRWFRSRAKVFFDDQGVATRMSGAIQDIHERRMAQAELKERSEQMGAIFSLTPEGFVSFDDLGNVSYASPAFAPLTGLAPDSVLGMSEAELVAALMAHAVKPVAAQHFDDLPRTRTLALPGSTGPQEQRTVIEMKAPARPMLELSLHRGHGTVSKMLHLRDVTHETELDRMKSAFMSMAAHELRTPMASIFGFTELLLSRDLKPEKQKDMLGRIQRQSEVMISIINELLDLARIEARQGRDFRHEPCDLLNLVHALVMDYQPPAGRSAPVVQAPTGPLQPVWVDAQATQQALLNVVSNAFKYSPQGGQVTIELLADEQRAHRCGVRVRDQGIGMTPEQLARVGERFYRVDKSGNIPGTGLGMSIVRETLDLMGGSVAIESRQGEGTTVTLWFPVAPEMAQVGERQ